jgi:hypothetical protein
LNGFRRYFSKLKIIRHKSMDIHAEDKVISFGEGPEKPDRRIPEGRPGTDQFNKEG